MSPSPSLTDRIARIELLRVCVPLVRPIESAHGVERDRWSILVRAVGTDDVEGWGECPALAEPTYTSEWHEGAWSVLVNHLAPAALSGRSMGVRGHPMAMSAMEGALVDLELRRRDTPLSVAIGATREAVDVCAVIGIAPTVDELLAEVATRLDAGHRAVKLKIRPGWDTEPLGAVRQAWPDLTLAADANGSYEQSDQSVVAALDSFGLVYLEQPLAPDDLVGSARLAASVGTPIAIDESAKSFGVVEAALALGSMSVVSLKPARLGGIVTTVDLHSMLVSRGVPMFCGGMMELGVGRAAALAVAALPGCTLPTDLGPSANYVTDDIVEPFVMRSDGTLVVPTGPGIGRTPDLERLDEVVIARRTIGG